MKKLLALVLCVMLFVSVIPAAAYAELSGSGVDLSAAYLKMQALYGAYGALGEATAYKNAILGIRALETKDNKTALEEGPIAKLIAALKEVTVDGHAGVSPKGLFELVAPVIIEALNMVGNQVVADSEAAIQKSINSVGKSVDAIIASFA